MDTVKGQSNRPPTLRTVAELAGVSLSTASLCLRGGESVKDATRTKVLAIAKQVGYVPNRAGVRLRTGRTNVITLVLEADWNILDYTRQLIQGIAQQIQGTRFHLNVIPELSDGDHTRAVQYILENRSADGVILTHTTARDPRVEMLLEADFPFVCHGRTQFHGPHPYHDFDAERYVGMAVDRLVQHGRRRILLAAVDNGTTNYAMIRGSFLSALRAHGLEGEVLLDSRRLNSASQARQAGMALAHLDEPFDGIVSNNEMTALAIISGLNEAGFARGREFDLICKQVTEILPMLHPGLETLREDLVEAGQELSRILMARINGAEMSELQTLQEPIPNWGIPE